MKRYPILRTILLAALLIVTPVANITTPAGARDKPKIPTGSFGCTAAVKKFEKWSKGFEHAAIAVGRAKGSITGIKGCYYSWDKKSRAVAEREAMRGCKNNFFRKGKCEIAKSN